MFPILFKIGPLTLHAYGLMVALGVFLALKVLVRQAALDGFSEKTTAESLYSLGFVLILSGILGARIFYALTHWDEFSGAPLSVLKIWQGGLVFYGGFIAAAAAFFIWNRTKPFAADWRRVADWTAPALAFGHALGRLGCFAAGCCYGKVADLPWSVTFHDPECLAPRELPLHPSQIYEFLFLISLGFFLLRRLSAARRSPARVPGNVFFSYLLIYSLGRFALEFLRGDEPSLWGLSPGQFTSLLIFASALVFRAGLRRSLILIDRNHRL